MARPLLRKPSFSTDFPVILVDPEYRGGLPGCYVAEHYPEIIDLIREGYIPVIRERWAALYDLVWKFGECLLLIDEAPDMGAKRGAVHPSLWKILRRGRHRRISTVLATQRRTELDARVQGICQGAFIGCLPGESDKRWAVGTWGIDPPEDPMLFRAILPGNQRGEIRISIR